MWEWLIAVVIALLFAIAGAWVTGRVLDAPVEWVRGIITGVVVFVLCVPLVLWSLERSDVIVDGRVAVQGPIAWLFLLLTLGWLFAIVVAALVTLEVVWPSRRLNPYRAVKDAAARRDRQRRYAQIVRMLSRRGLTFRRAQRRGDAPDLPNEVVAAMGEAGVTFVKLGQVLSTRDDMLPHEFTDAFATLQMDATPIPWSEARPAIETELGRPIAEVFGEVDEVPLAAASVAQVHAARLVDGTAVVIKIQRPRAREEVTVDLDILQRLADDAEKHTDWGSDYGARVLAGEFARALTEELDYRVEASNTELMRATLGASEAPVHVPRVFSDFSTSRMLVQERVEGVPFGRITDPAFIGSAQATAVADAIVDSIFEQIALRGVFHADLHPGNLILTDDGEVWLIDFGAVGILEKSLRRLLVSMLLAIVNEDDVATTDIALMICEPAEGLDAAALQHDVGVILTRVHNVEADASLFGQLIETLRRHRLALPPALMLVFRTLGSLEGTLRRIAPDYHLVERGLSRVPHFAQRMVSFRDAALTAQTYAATSMESLRRLPRRIESLATGLERGTLAIGIRPFDTPAQKSWIDGLVAQLLTTLIGIVLVAASVVLLAFGEGPLLTGDVPLLPFLGAVLGLGGFLLVLRSLRIALARRSAGAVTPR
ncbi:MAG: AarF/UbiB family protein [Microbacterium sp.]